MSGRFRVATVVAFCAGLVSGGSLLAATPAGHVYERNVGDESKPLAGVTGAEERAHVKWSQPPVEIDPNLEAPPVFCSRHQPSKSSVLADGRQVWNFVLDDFRCPGSAPVTRLRWWGFYKGWTKSEPPANRPLRWQVTFWRNRPEVADANLYPEKMVRRVDIPVERVVVEPAGMDAFPHPFSEMCYRYELALEPNEWFRQGEFSSEQDIYWVGVAAVYAAGTENRNLWGWATRPTVWRNPGQIIVLYGDGPDANTQLWPERLLPVSSSELCGQERGYDMAFELLTEPPGVLWDQPFGGLREWPQYADLESQGLSTVQEETLGRVVADDWLCEPNAPVIAAAWWGSYIGYGHEACTCAEQREPPRPDYFLLTMSTNAGPTHETPYSCPGETVWQYRAYDYDEVLVGYDRNPEGEPNEPVFRYSVRLPAESWFRSTAGGTYWLSVMAIYTDPLPVLVHPWGWTNHPSTSDAGAVFIDYRARPRPEWRPLRDSADQPIDMSFTLFTRPE